MIDKHEAARRAAWGRLWAQGAPASFAYGRENSLPLQVHWHAFFSSLPPNIRVLDLGTGNGVLPRWLLACRDDDATQCDAVDITNIAPTWLNLLTPAQRARLRFHSRTAAENLPWQAATFDTIVSQFGAEYGELRFILAEVDRIARPYARLHMIMHHTESLPCALAHEEIGHVEWLRNEGWLAAAQAMIEPMGLLSSAAGRSELNKTTHWNGIREAFDAQQLAVQARISSSTCPDILIEAQNIASQHVFRIASHRGYAAGLNALNFFIKFLSDTHTRLTDMRTHAQTALQIEAHTHILWKYGWNVSFNTVYEHDSLMGWVIDAIRIN